jgi:8-oxo-dGTP pyrophosphatase MutT (NUDIX family)
MILDLDYANFKDRLGATLGGRHLQAAHKVWHDLHLLEDPSPTIPDGDNLPPPGLKPAYGGVVMSADGTQILLREPRNHFGGYVWTFAKGRPERGDDAWSCAQREIREELGCTVRDPIPVPGWFTGDTTATRFFLCTHVADIQPPDHDETSCVRWVSWEAAASMIAQTTTRTGRERDLAVLAAAQTLHRSRRA